MIEYYRIGSEFLNITTRQLLAGILGSSSLSNDEDFKNAILEKFQENRISIIVDSAEKENLEKYILVSGVSEKLEKQTAAETINGKCPILLFDNNYRYTPPEGYTPQDASWIRINFAVNTRTKTAKIYPLPLLFREAPTPTSEYVPEVDIEDEEVKEDLNVIKSEVMTNVTQTERMIQPTRLTLKIPNFSPDSDNISEVMERLGKILPYTGNQISPVIINFLQNSGLEHLLLSLNPNELSNFNDFKQAMVNRY